MNFLKVRVGGLAASILLSDVSDRMEGVTEEKVVWVEAVVPIAATRAAVRGDVGVGRRVGEGGVADIVVGRSSTIRK